jgi:hypothetical protein
MGRRKRGHLGKVRDRLLKATYQKTKKFFEKLVKNT